MTGPDAEAKLAAAALAAADDERAVLEAGKVPEQLGAAAASFAASRSSGSRWIGGTTPALRRWLEVATAFAAEHDGRAPTVTEFAAAADRSRTAAQDAIRRLRAIDRWPPGRDDPPHAPDQTPGVEV